jgi:glycosyltransferase involved in cell wall biosynthesis
MRPDEAALVAPRRYPLRDYLARLGRSVVALNTPAVHDCFGWKLGEYLALGKAVVSLPLTRSGPAPLVDGQELVVVDGSEEAIVAAVEGLAGDRARRHDLERAARAYYDRWLRPDAVAARLLDSLSAT